MYFGKCCFCCVHFGCLLDFVYLSVVKVRVDYDGVYAFEVVFDVCYETFLLV